MKVMSRDFTVTEKILLTVLVLILVGLAYYYFVDQPVRATVTSLHAEESTLQSELTTTQARIAYLEKIRDYLVTLQEDDNMSYMGSYNNSEAEVRFLNDILANTLQYSISFANVTRNNNQIRRSFTLQYRTENYAAAQDIMTQLLRGRNRCLIGDVKCSIDPSTGFVTMNQSATFYETMVGGAPDAGLPADAGAVNR